MTKKAEIVGEKVDYTKAIDAYQGIARRTGLLLIGFTQTAINDKEQTSTTDRRLSLARLNWSMTVDHPRLLRKEAKFF